MQKRGLVLLYATLVEELQNMKTVRENEMHK